MANLIGFVEGDKVFSQNQPPEKIQSLMSSITYPDSAPLLLGSWALRALPYPADVDICDIVDLYTDDGDPAMVMTSFIQDLVRKIVRSKSWYFTDLKAGYENGDSIHWRAKEILDGRRNGKTDVKGHKSVRELEDVIGDSTLKLDLVATLDGKLTEVSVVYLVNMDGEPWNHGGDMFDVIANNIRHDGRTQWNDGNYLKSVKRAFSYSRLYKDVAIGEMLAPLLGSHVAQLGQMSSYLKTLKLLTDSGYVLSASVIKRELKSILRALNYILDLNIPNMSDIFDDIYKVASAAHKKWVHGESKEQYTEDTRLLAQYLDDAARNMDAIANNATLIYLDDNGIMSYGDMFTV